MKVDINPPLLKSLLTLGQVIEARDPYTGGHTWRVSRYARMLGERYGLDRQLLFVLEVGALVHDLGKVGVPDSILNKKGPLDDSETPVMRAHPVVGAEIVQSHPLYPLVRHVITEHHERLDGSGYPSRLDGEDITLWGKLVAIADSFDAMTSVRPYRAALAPENALNLLEAGKGSQYDSFLVDLFVDIGRSGGFSHILSHAGENRMMQTCVQCGPVIPMRAGLKPGETVQCPVCTGRYVAHSDGGGFSIEFSGHRGGLYVPRPDEDTVKSVMRNYVKTVRL